MIDKALFLVYNIIVVMSEDITGYMQTYRSGHNGADSKSVCGQPHVSSNLTVCAIMWRQKRCLLRKARLCRAFLLPKRRFFSVPKRRCKIAVFPLWIDLNSRKVNIRYARQIKNKNLSAFSITLKRRNQICYRKN